MSPNGWPAIGCFIWRMSHRSPPGAGRPFERFVQNGGGLLAGYGTSLYGAAGERLDRFELEALLRVRRAHAQGELDKP